MPGQPSFFGEGSTTLLTDTRWISLVKQLGGYQNTLGGSALPSNNPRRGDTLAILRKKFANAVSGTAYSGT